MKNGRVYRLTCWQRGSSGGQSEVAEVYIYGLVGREPSYCLAPFPGASLLDRHLRRLREGNRAVGQNRSDSKGSIIASGRTSRHLEIYFPDTLQVLCVSDPYCGYTGIVDAHEYRGVGRDVCTRRRVHPGEQ